MSVRLRGWCPYRIVFGFQVDFIELYENLCEEEYEDTENDEDIFERRNEKLDKIFKECWENVDILQVDNYDTTTVGIELNNAEDGIKMDDLNFVSVSFIKCLRDSSLREYEKDCRVFLIES